MALILNEEQLMLRESARDFLNSQAPVSHLRQLRDSANKEGFSRTLWQEMVNMGWTAILVPEEHGGLGYGFSGLGIVLEEAGRTLTPSPLLSTSLMGAAALLRAGTSDQKTALLPRLASGELLFAVAFEETQRHCPETVAVQAVAQDGGFRLRGRKVAVLDGHIADTLLVSARTAGNNEDCDGISLFLVPANTKGVQIEPYEVLDTHQAANISFDNVQLGADSLLGTLNQGNSVLQYILDVGRLGQSAELLGVAQEAFERTIQYLKDRKQFGVAIGSFQALQHRAAIIFGEIEMCKSLVINSLHSLDAGLDDLQELASMTKAKLCEMTANATAEAIQMHGGIGMTDEFDIGFYFKRTRILETFLGDRYYHLDRYALSRGY